MPLKHFVPTAIIALILEWNGDLFWCVGVTSLINYEFLKGKDHLLLIFMSPGPWRVLSG